jgi:hypothetical protein
MKDKKYILYFLIIMLLSFIGYSILRSDQWDLKKRELANMKLSKITLYTGGSNAKNVELTGADKDNFMNCLLTSKFYRENRYGAIDGGMAIVLISEDGSNDSFEYCGGSVFQISYKGNLFSIKNKELEQILLKYNVTV